MKSASSCASLSDEEMAAKQVVELSIRDFTQPEPGTPLKQCGQACVH